MSCASRIGIVTLDNFGDTGNWDRRITPACF